VRLSARNSGSYVALDGHTFNVTIDGASIAA
jgi:hypothetical protein